MSSIIADTIKGRSGKASDFPEGATVTGVVTSTTFKGALTGNVTGDVSGSSGSCTGNAATATLATNASGLTGTPSITVQDVTAEYVSIGGTLTYDDVVNVDSVGIVTAGKGLRVTTGGVDIIGITTGLKVSGVSTFVGLSTFADGVEVLTGAGFTVSANANFKGGLIEKVNIVADNLSDGANVDVSNGNVHYYSVNEDATGTPNLRWDGSTTLGSVLKTGDTLTVSIIYKPNGAGYYEHVTIDGVAQTEEWLGGSAPSSANAGGYDIVTYQLVRTGTGTGDYIVLANVSNFA